MTGDTITIHVASRSPSVLAGGGTGEFVWRWDREDAAEVVAGWLVRFARDENVNVALTSLQVPEPQPGEETVEVIDRWLDRNWHLIEVAFETDAGALHLEPV